MNTCSPKMSLRVCLSEPNNVKELPNGNKSSYLKCVCVAQRQICFEHNFSFLFLVFSNFTN